MSDSTKNDSTFPQMPPNDRRADAFKLMNDFLVDIMGAIIPGFLTILTAFIVICVPIFLIEGKMIPAEYFSAFFSFGALVLILVFSYVIGHVFYRADINEPDKASIKKKIKGHIKSVVESFINKSNEPKNIPDNVPKTLPPAIEKRTKKLSLKNDVKKTAEDFYKKLITSLENESNTTVDVSVEFDNIKHFFSNYYLSRNPNDNQPSFFRRDRQNDNPNDNQYTLNDYLKLIDILSDIIEYIIAYSEEKSKFDDQDVLKALQIFLDEAKYIDFCDNYDEFQYLFQIIRWIRHAKKNSDNSDNKYIKDLNIVLEDYQQKVLSPSGVQQSYVSYYNEEIKEHLERSRKVPKKNKEIIQRILAFAAIRRAQNEEGSPHKDAGGFPYINYQNYLIRRNLHHLAESVNWNYREGRTKNQINRYKIKIQLFAPEAYGVLNKNESHIRMASSSWFACKFLFWFTVSAIVVFALVVGALFYTNVVPLTLTRTDYHALRTIALFVAILVPVPVAIVLKLARRKIEDFIHYQRLREIYFTIYTYHECRIRIHEAERKGSQ